MKVLIKREVGEVKDTRRIKREEVERGEEAEAERELWWPGEEMRREAEEAGGPRGQEWRIGLATIGEELLPGERDKLSGSKNEALGLLTPLQKPSPSLRNLGTEGQRGHRKTDKALYQEASSNRKLNYYVQLALEIKSHFFENKILGGERITGFHVFLAWLLNLCVAGNDLALLVLLSPHP